MQSKEETLFELKRVLPKVKEVESYSNLMQQERQKFKKLKMWDNFSDYESFSKDSFKLLLALPSILLIVLVIFGLGMAMQNGFGAILAVASVGVGFVLAGLFMAKLSYPIYKRMASKANAPIIDYNNKITPEINRQCELLEKKKNEVIDEVLSFTSIPAKYLTSPIISTFIEYLENYKADNFKECVLLAEEESRYNESLKRYSGITREINNVSTSLNNIHASNTMNSMKR